MRRSSQTTSTLKECCLSAILILILGLCGIDADGAEKSWFELTHLVETPGDKDVRTFLFGVVSDLDADSPVLKIRNGKLEPSGDLAAYLREGILVLTRTGLENRPFNVSIQMDSKKGNFHIMEILSKLAYGGRGMEMSTLANYNDEVYACDDKTGVVYQLPIAGSERIVPIPWAILADGDFEGPKGFKCEWSTVKDGDLVIGGHGGPGSNNRFVKVITAHGGVSHVNWTLQFKKIADALDVHFPGYVTHEAIGWSSSLGKWLIMPRKVSKGEYTEETNERSGTNLYLIADEDFENFEVKEIGEQIPTHGFSAFAFVPSTDDSVVVALKSVEAGELVETYIMAFDLSGNILFPETKFAAQKYEGLEFLMEIE